MLARGRRVAYGMGARSVSWSWLPFDAPQPHRGCPHTVKIAAASVPKLTPPAARQMGCRYGRLHSLLLLSLTSFVAQQASSWTNACPSPRRTIRRLPVQAAASEVRRSQRRPPSPAPETSNVDVDVDLHLVELNDLPEFLVRRGAPTSATSGFCD